MSEAKERLKALWAKNVRTIEDELADARESAMLHAQAVDELRRDLDQAKREITRLRLANRELQADLDRIQRVLK